MEAFRNDPSAAAERIQRVWRHYLDRRPPPTRPQTSDADRAAGLVRVDVPPGPMGMKMKVGPSGKGVMVTGFASLNAAATGKIGGAGKKGAIELHGGVWPGMYAVRVDGDDVSQLTFLKLCRLLQSRYTAGG